MYKWVCWIMRNWDGMDAHMGLWVEGGVIMFFGAGWAG
jgi:hypothetical protein